MTIYNKEPSFSDIKGLCPQGKRVMLCTCICSLYFLDSQNVSQNSCDRKSLESNSGANPSNIRAKPHITQIYHRNFENYIYQKLLTILSANVMRTKNNMPSCETFSALMCKCIYYKKIPAQQCVASRIISVMIPQLTEKKVWLYSGSCLTP